MSKDDDDDDGLRPLYRTNYGDIGVVIIAAFCTIAFILMMVLPSPVAKYQKEKAQEELKARQEALQKPIPGGEVSVGIAPTRH
ncbi:MAG TPA: hypothetical protein VHZ32_09460 [Rhizomicrobium sp.]|jgi:hypothetical protein|nr:hypothetical protein [Rhizomicrobium sp.]